MRLHRLAPDPADRHLLRRGAPDAEQRPEDEVVRRGGATADLAVAEAANALHGVLGNAMVGGADLDGGGAALVHHSVGVLSLVAAGVDAAALMPGQAPPSVMRQVMRRSQAEEEGLDTARASRNIGTRQGAPLPGPVRERMERAFGHDFGHVRIHTDGGAADAAVSLNAVAFAVGEHIYFNRGAYRPGTPGGDELLAHELTHIVQADEGRLPSAGGGGGMDVSSPTDRHELEAVQMGREVSRTLARGAGDSVEAVAPVEADQVQAVGLPSEIGAGEVGAGAGGDAGGAELVGAAEVEAGGGSGEGLASRSWWSNLFGSGGSGSPAAPNSGRGGGGQSTRPGPTSGPVTSARGPGAGADDRAAGRATTLTLAGIPIRVERGRGEDGKPSATVTINRSPIPGVTLRTGTLDFDESENITGGTVTADVSLGGAVQASGVQLQVRRDGSVASTIPDVDVRLTDALTAKVGLTVAREGVHGQGTLSYEQLNLPAGLGINAGQVNVAVGPDGAVTAGGTLTGVIEGLGTSTATVRYAEGAFGAELALTLTGPVAPVPGVSFTAGSLRGQWTQGVTEVPIQGTLGVDIQGWVAGQAAATYVIGTGAWSVTGELNQVVEKQFGPLTSVSAHLRLSVVDNAVTGAHCDVNWTAPKLQGTLNATYDIEAQALTGEGTASLTEDHTFEAAWGSFTLKAGGNLEAGVEANALSRLEGIIPFEATVLAGQQPVSINGRVEGQVNPETHEVQGEVNGLLLNDVTLLTDRGDALVLQKDAVVRATLAANALSDVFVDASVRMDRDGEPLLTGTITDGQYHVEDSTVNFVGDLTLARDIEHVSEDGQWTLRAKEGSRIGCTVQNNVVTQLSGDLDFTVEDSEGPLLDGAVTGATLDTEELKASGEVAMTTARPFLHPRQTEGAVEGTGWQLEVLQGSGVSGAITDNELQTLGAELNMKVSDPEGHLADVALNAEWNVAEDVVNGTGQITLAREIPVAEGLGPEGWSARVVPGAEATAHIEDNDFTKVDGQLDAKVADAEADFIDVHGEGLWTTADDQVQITGEATVTRDKALPAVGAWQATVLKDSKASTTLTNEAITDLSGRIDARVDRDGEPLIKAGLQGTWSQTTGLGGEGSAELLRDVDVATVGNYGLRVVKGAGATVKMAEGDVTEVGGRIPMALDENEQPFIKGEVGGTYDVEGKVLDGTGSAEVLVERRLGTLGSDQLWLTPGTGAEVTIAQNVLTRIGGTVNLSARDGGGQYVTIALEGAFDAAGGTGFTGKGAATVTREKQLFATDGYSFLVIPGTGATAHVVENQLTKIDGAVPFEVRDAQGALIRGSVNGDYSAETGQINGTGNVTLGRTLEYNLGGGAVIKLLEGSGGDADVVDSQLTRLGGTLKAELWTDGVAQVRVEANGEYNVVTNTLETLEGSAEMLRPFQLLNGAVEIRDVTGTAKIADNQLVAAEGGGTIVIIPLNNMQGDFHVKWSNEGGVDQYEGEGQINFTLFEDASKGRKLEGEVDARYASDGTFDVNGQATYTMNEILKDISVGVQMDQTLDPTLNIDATVQATLVEARNLFGMERDIIPKQFIPVYGPLGVFYGLKGGMKLDMDALTMDAHIGVSDWKPVSQASEVPNFRADMSMAWGLDFQAALVPYVGVEANLAVASVGGGVRGLAELKADLDVNPSGFIAGGPDGFHGELSVGVRLSPEVNLSLTPFVQAQITGLDPWTHNFAAITQNVGEIMPFEWGGTYRFGDTPQPKTAPRAVTQGTATQTTRAVATSESSGTGMRGGGGPATAKKGAPQLESGNEIASQQETGEASELDKLMAILDKVQKLGAGIEALGYLAGLVIGVITATATLGPIGFIGWCIWKIFKGELSWDRIKEAIDKLVVAMQTCMEILEPHLPPWFQRIRQLFTGRKPSIFDALFGADDRMRDAVRDGYHLEAPTEMRIEMINTMNSGWVSDDDAACIAQVLEAAGGSIHQVLAGVDGGARGLLNKGLLESFNDEPIKRVYRRHGIPT